MSLAARVDEMYAAMEKNQHRLFNKQVYGSLQLFSLPNGISIFHNESNSISLFQSIPFQFIVKSNNNGWVVIQKVKHN